VRSEAARLGRRWTLTRRPSLALAYHALSDDWDNPLAIPIARFASHMHRLSAMGYTAVCFGEFARLRHRGGLLAITFDDAFSSALTRAVPILAELGWPATVFASTAAVDAQAPMRYLLGNDGRPPRDEATLQPLSWDALRECRDLGWEIGSHGVTHRRLSSLSPDERRTEIETARHRIETEVGPCASISYPWGEVTEDVVEAAVRAGHSAGSGLAGRFADGDNMRVPRFAISRMDGRGRFALKTSRSAGSIRRSAVWSALEHARRREYEPVGDTVDRTRELQA